MWRQEGRSRLWTLSCLAVSVFRVFLVPERERNGAPLKGRQRGMGLFGVPPRAADQQATERAERECCSQNDDVLRPEEDVVTGHCCRLARKGRCGSEMAAAAPGRRERTRSGAGGGQGGDRLVRNRGRRGRALVGTAFFTALTLSQGEGSCRIEERACKTNPTLL